MRLFQEDLDSEGEERTKKKPSKFKDDLKLKKKFNALLRKMKLNDTDEPMIDDEVGFVSLIILLFTDIFINLYLIQVAYNHLIEQDV